MPIRRPDTYEHNNPLNSFVDSNFIRGGARTAVANLTELYQLSSVTGNLGQLKNHATRVWVHDQNQFYTLTDTNQASGVLGWLSDSVYLTGNLSRNTSNWQSTYSTVSSLSANWTTAHSTVSSLSSNWSSVYSTVNLNSAVNWNYQGTDLKALSGRWDSNYSTVNSLSGNWNSTTTSVQQGSSNWYSASGAAVEYVHSNFLPLTGGVVSGDVRFNSNITIFGNLSSSGTQTFANTVFTTTSALSIVHFGSGPALWVGNNGDGDIASFYDIDQNIEVFHIGGNNGTFPNVGVKTSNPGKDFTVNGEISSTSIIYDKSGNSVNWNSSYSTVNSNSAINWNYQGTDLKALSGRWDSNYSTVNSLSENWTTAHSTVSSLSANWTTAHSTVSSLSGNWTSVYSTVNSNSAINWTTKVRGSGAGTYETGEITLSGTGDVTISQNGKTIVINSIPGSGTGGVLNGSGTTNTLTKWTGTGSLGNSILTENNGNVGINTSSPNKSLTIIGDISAVGNHVLESSSSAPVLRINQTGNGNALMVEDSDHPDVSPFVIDGLGTVIIGASASHSGTNPVVTRILQVVTSTSGSRRRVNFKNTINSTNGPGIEFVKTRTNNVNDTTLNTTPLSSGDFIGDIIFNGNSTQLASIIGVNKYNTNTGDAPQGSILSFSTAASGQGLVPRLVINEDKIGIGVDFPNEKLSVFGNISSAKVIYSESSNSIDWSTAHSTVSSLSANWSSVYSTVNSNSAINWNYQGTDLKALSGRWDSNYSTVNSNSAINWNYQGTDLKALSGRWDSSYSTVNSNSAINWNYQGTDLKALSGRWDSNYSTVNSLSSNWILDNGNIKNSNLLIGTNDNFSFGIKTNNVQRIVINNQGNIGIATTSPNEKLSVFGNISVSGVVVSTTASVIPSANTSLPLSNDVVFDGQTNTVTITSFNSGIPGTTYTLTNKSTHEVTLSSSSSLFIRGGGNWSGYYGSSGNPVGKIELPQNYSCSLRMNTSNTGSAW
jgi:hypothetical protein